MGNSSSRVSLIETVIIFVGAWTLVTRWDLVIDNFAYRTLGHNKKSTWQTFIVALFATALIILLIWILDLYTNGGAEIIFDNS
jgi:hypothetical protein